MPNDRGKRIALAFVVAGLVVVIDQATKATAFIELSTTERVPLLGDLLGLQLAFNPGALLSLGSQFTWLLTVLGIVAIVLLTIAAIRARTTAWAVGLGVILGGAIGNTIDRLFSPPGFGVGYVTDFLAYGTWFIGNLADVALAVGAIILLATLWRQRRSRQTDGSKRAGLDGAAPTTENAQ